MLGRSLDRVLAHEVGQPIGGVELAEVVALLGVDQTLVQDLEDVVLDLPEAETTDLAGDPHNEHGPARRLEHPIE